VHSWYVRVPGVRKIAIHAVIGRGIVELEGMPDALGRATGALADVAAGDLSGAELSSMRDRYEIELWSAGRLHDAEVSLVVPKDELARGVELQRMVLATPAFPKKDVKRWVLDQELYYTVNGPSSQSGVASAAMSFAWFPADHAYGARPDLAELETVKTRDLRARWEAWTHEAPITLVVTGDVPWETVEPAVLQVAEGLGAKLVPGEALVVAPPASRIIAVDMPGQTQVAVRLRMEGPPRTHADLPAMQATNFLLGGHFLSRLNRNLREARGFTYGSRSAYAFAETWGNVTVEVDVKAENVAATILEIERELQRFVNEPVPPEELDAMRRSLDADWNRTFETAETAMGLYRRALTNEATVAQLRERLVKVGETTTEDVARVTRKWLDADRTRVWVFVGDRKTLEPQLVGLGAPVEWIDPPTAILGRF
jgi:zinc protease